MAGLNDCRFIGNAGGRPELKTGASGNEWARFNLAVNESWKNRDGERVERVEWIPLVLFGKLATAVDKYVEKGRQLYVSGRWQTRDWEEEVNGKTVKRYKTELVVNSFQMLGRRLDNETTRQPDPPAAAYTGDVGELGPPLDLDQEDQTSG